MLVVPIKKGITRAVKRCNRSVVPRPFRVRNAMQGPTARAEIRRLSLGYVINF